jgi:epoxyqueuosine reductase
VCSSDLPQIAKYAYGKDYHIVIKNMLHRLLHRIKEQYGNVSGRAFVDSAPVLEHAWAARSGVGWTGKHSLTIHPQYGSYIFLGELIIDIETEPDQPIADRCGTCTRCMDSCPVQAIVAPYTVDARRCLSYLTVEHKGHLDPAVRLHHRMFGCDICQDVCPWNKKARPTGIEDFRPNPDILHKTAEDWLQLTKGEFDALTADSPLQRAGYEVMVKILTTGP